MNLKDIKAKLYDPTYKYFTLEGRISKKEFLDKYAMPMFAFIICAIVLSIVGGILIGVLASVSATVASILALVLNLVILIPGIFITVLCACGQVRRFHDFGVTGWVILVAHLIGLGIVTLIVSLVVEGKPEANQYGEAPVK